MEINKYLNTLSYYASSYFALKTVNCRIAQIASENQNISNCFGIYTFL